MIRHGLLSANNTGYAGTARADQVLAVNAAG
jgi:hypothetical protein